MRITKMAGSAYGLGILPGSSGQPNVTDSS
jgi:hypothetical protein